MKNFDSICDFKHLEDFMKYNQSMFLYKQIANDIYLQIQSTTNDIDDAIINKIPFNYILILDSLFCSKKDFLLIVTL